MSLTILLKELKELNEKEKKIQDFYDPVKVHRFQHPHIQDLRDDHREDIQNYGFSRFALKEDLSEISVDRGQQHQKQLLLQQQQQQQSTQHSHQGGMSQLQSPQAGNNGTLNRKNLQSARPTTAMNSNSQKSLNFGANSQANLAAATMTTVVSDQQTLLASTLNKRSTVQSAFMQTGRPMTAAFQQTLGTTIQSVNARTIQSAANYKSNNNNKEENWGFDSINDRMASLGGGQAGAGAAAGGGHRASNNYNNPDEFEEFDGEYEFDSDNFDPTRATHEFAGAPQSPGLDTASKIAKHWKFTKKYDTNGKAAIRNQSALKKIAYEFEGSDGTGSEEVDDDTLKQRAERQMEGRFNKQKIFITKSGEVCIDKPKTTTNSQNSRGGFNHHMNNQTEAPPRKLSPGILEKDAFIESFQQQKLFLDEDAAQLRKIYAFNQKESKKPSSQKLSALSAATAAPTTTGQALQQSQSNVRFQIQKQSSNNNHVASTPALKRPQTAIDQKANYFPAKSSLRPPSAMVSLPTSMQGHPAHPLSANQQFQQQQSQLSSINLVTKDELKLSQMRRIKGAVLDRNGPNRFFASTKDLSPLVLTDWYFPNLRQDFSFKVQVTDMKSMNFVKYDNVKVINDELVHTSFKDEKQVVDFESILELMSRQHQPSHTAMSPLHFFHIIIHQKLQSDEESILYEKFVFKGSASRFLELNVINILLVYYIRYLLCFDPSDISFTSIYDNSLYILEKKKSIPIPFYEFFLKLSQKAIYVEDMNQRTFEHYIFPQLQVQLSTQEYHQLPSTGNYVMPLTKFLEQNTNPKPSKPQNKRPTTAQPNLSSQGNNNNQFVRYSNNLVTGDNESIYEQDEFLQSGSIQSQSQSQQQQQQQQHLNEQSMDSMLRKGSHPALKTNSQQNLNSIQRELASSPVAGFLHRQAYPLDYSKSSGQNKQGLRPKTAMNKPTRSPSAGMLSAIAPQINSTTSKMSGSDAYSHKHQRSTPPTSAQNKNFERNIKSVTSGIFIKGKGQTIY